MTESGVLNVLNDWNGLNETVQIVRKFKSSSRDRKSTGGFA